MGFFKFSLKEPPESRYHHLPGFSLAVIACFCHLESFPSPLTFIFFTAKLTNLFWSCPFCTWRPVVLLEDCSRASCSPLFLRLISQHSFNHPTEVILFKSLIFILLLAVSYLSKFFLKYSAPTGYYTVVVILPASAKIITT